MEYGPASADSRPINDSLCSPSRLARYVADQAGGVVAGWSSDGRVRTRSAALEDVSELVDPAIDQAIEPVAPITEPVAPIADPDKARLSPLCSAYVRRKAAHVHRGPINATASAVSEHPKTPKLPKSDAFER